MSRRLSKDDFSLLRMCQSHHLLLFKTKVETDTSCREKHFVIESLTRFVLLSGGERSRSRGWDGEMNRTCWGYDNDDGKNNAGIIEVINRGKHSQEPLWHRLSVAGRRRNQQPTLGGTSTAALKYSCVSLSSFPYVNEPGEPPRWPGEAANFCWTKWPTLSRWSSSRSRNDDFWCVLHLKGSEQCLTSRLEDPLV